MASSRTREVAKSELGRLSLRHKLSIVVFVRTRHGGYYDVLPLAGSSEPVEAKP